MRETLSWFETKPLFGWRVLVPRTKEQAGALSDQLRRYGAVPEEVPTISVEPPRTPQQMERAIKGLVPAATSGSRSPRVNAVRAVREKFEEYGLDARAFAGIKVAAVGEQTAPAWSLRASSPTWCPAASSRPPGCSRTGRRTTRCSTRSTGCSCRAPTSPPRPWWPGWSSSAGRSTTSRRTARCAPRRRRADPRGDQERRVRRRASSPRPRRCATSSASPASRTPPP